MKILKLTVFLFLLFANLSYTQNHDKLWNKVETLELKGEIKNANKVVSKIFEKAKKNNDSKDIIKSFIYKSKFNLTLIEDGEIQFVEDILSQIETNTFPTNVILENIYTNFLIDFYNKNRYKFRNRTPIKDKGDDIQTWDLESIQLEIHNRFQNVLQNPEALKKVKLKDYITLLKGSTNALKYRPTLYDYFTHDAISYYNSVGNGNFNTNVIKNSKRFYKPSDSFINAPINIKETPRLNTLKLYQDIEAFHLKEKNYFALFDVLIKRLQYLNSRTQDVFTLGMNSNFNAHEDVIIKTIDRFKDEEESAYLRFHLANHYNINNHYGNYSSRKPIKDAKIKAHNICEETIAKYPNTEGGIKCKTLKKSLESKFLDFETNKVLSNVKPALTKVTYSNTDSLYLSIYKVPVYFLQQSNPDISDYFKRSRFSYDSIVFNKIQNTKPIITKTYNVNSGKDYFKHSAELLIPKLELGNYIVVFSNKNKIVSKEDYAYQTTSRSNLFLTLTNLEKENAFAVTNREKGVPINNAVIEISSVDKSYQIRKKTNQYGIAKENKIKNRKYNLNALVTYKNDSLLVSDVDLDDYDEDEENEWNVDSKIILDRQIYRPGQFIHFKGYLFQKKNGKRSVVKNMFCSVLISDSKGNDLKEYRLKTNEFGTVSGSYKLPKNILTGEFDIELDEDYDYEEDEHPFWDKIDNFEYTDKSFLVEEYKRPKFEIKFDKVTENYTLNDSIFIKGKALSFFNSTISNATVKYSVKTLNDYKKSPRAIGEVKTNATGDFIIPFLAKSNDTRKWVKYDYIINAEVTDINGETISAKKEVRIGNQSFDFVIKKPYNITNESRNPILLVSKNLNHGYVPSKGELKIYRNGNLSSSVFKRQWQAAEFQTVDKDTFTKYYPQLKYKQDHENEKLLVQKTGFNVKDSLHLKLNVNNLKTGSYIIEGYTVSKNKDTVKINESFNYKNLIEEDKSYLFKYDVENFNFKKDGKASVKLISSFNDVNINARVLFKGKEIYNKYFNLNKEYVFNVPINQNDFGELTLLLSSNKYGAFDTKTFNLNITESDDAFEIETKTFRSKLTPDTKENWSFKIKSLDKNVEVLASMYDESLDAFFKDKDDDYYTLDWDSKFEIENDYAYYNRPNIKNFDKNTVFSRANKNSFYYVPQNTKYLELNYFGLDFRNFKYQNKRYLERLKKKKNYTILPLGNVSGLVLDSDDGMPMAGVNIIVKGTNRGTQSDFDGFYSIEAKKGEVLAFSFVGYTIEEVAANSDNINVSLDPGTALEEVVITALGIKRYQKLPGYNISYNTVSDFNIDVQRKLKSLSGSVSGLQVKHTNSTRIVLRGNRSIKGDKQALIVVDGVIVDATTMTNINPTSIANVNVIKGAEGSALYGSQGSNGVIIISTKFGSKTVETEEGKTIIDITGEETSTIETRKNLQETAFFFPHLKTDNNNEITVNFKGPQALTRWKFQLLAHTKNLQYGYTKLNTITQKDLVVVPNLPRFLREGDSITISSKITNTSENDLNGNTFFELYNEETNEAIGTFKNKAFSIKSKATKEVSWLVSIPENVEKIRYRILAKTDTFSDGEEGFLDVLKKRILVTETLPLFVNASEEKVFNFDKLATNNSKTLTHDVFTVQYSANPSWLAIESLPYLIEFPYDCAEQTYSKYYANAIGNHILTSNPKIKEYINTLDSSNSKKLGLLFNSEKLEEQETNTISKLKELQLNNGAFSWFSNNGKPNTFITNHIVASHGHLKRLGIKSKNQRTADRIINNAITYLDDDFYLKIKKDDNYKNISLIHYLYARSFFLDTNALSKKNALAINTFLNILEKNWITQELYNKGLIALIFNRFNRKDVSKKILKALKQSSIASNEFGMYWKENTNSMYWYKSSIETQTLLIEAFAEINNDATSIDKMKLWLLNQKQTNSWKTTKATTEAIYALLLKGNDWLKINKKTNIKIADTLIENKTNPFGFFKAEYSKNEINNSLATVEIDNNSASPSFGGIYWQYFEDLDKITSAETPLKLKKKLFKKTNTDKGEVITDITKDTELKVGDLIRVRIELRSDRAMEFIHMKDMRAAGLEPINVLSQYKYQDGLGYYEATKDASTNFFFDYLPKGIYVFEYDLRVNNAGNMSNGITTIQSMYAPEFSSHSEGTRIKVN